MFGYFTRNTDIRQLVGLQLGATALTSLAIYQNAGSSKRKNETIHVRTL
jgi:hypothetical protein